ncbi:MAG: diguanylate cyclase [Magnetococcales bacterium]|nr:diguanylate cyclase [Magnetococcales bacterium]
MLKNNSLIYPILGFLALTALASVTSGYFINYAPVHKRIHQQLDEEIAAIGADVQARIDEEILGLPRLARVLQADKRLRRELSHFNEDPNADSERFHRYIKGQIELFNLDFLQLVNAEGRLIHDLHNQHLPPDIAPDQPAKPEFLPDIQEAMTYKRIVLNMAEEDNTYSIHATAPLFYKGAVLGAITIGTLINGAFSTNLSEYTGTKLALVSNSIGLFAVSDGSGKWPAVDIKMAREVILEGKRQFSEEHGNAQALFYQPVTFVDRTFTLVIFLPLEESHAPLFESAKRLVHTAITITILVVMLGGATYFVLIHPMRKLYGKARILLEVCSTSAGMVQPDPGRFRGNELQVLDNALETASMTVYANMGHLLEQKERFETLAVRDALTGLGNRRMFQDLLGTATALCRRHGGKLALFYMDLDKFKPINDTLGHDIGDMLLQEAASRLQEAVRDSDVVFRLGGDEFAALLPECSTTDLALEVGNRVLVRVKEPYHLKGHECSIGVSIGISLFPIHGEDIDTLLKSADSALYSVKESGRGRCAVAKPIKSA